MVDKRTCLHGLYSCHAILQDHEEHPAGSVSLQRVEFPSGEVEQVVSGIVVYEDRFLGDVVAHESEIRATLVRNKVSLHIAGWLKH
jgi:hypothetical protein